MRILVTGADGFTGRHFIEAAAAGGHEPVALRADLTQRDAVIQEVAMLQPEAVVHLAAIAFVGHSDERAFYDVNLFGTLHLLDALKTCKRLHKVLLASSANVYGNCAHSPITEMQPPAPVNHYASSKLAMEFMARARGSDLPLVITRPFNYTGVGQSGEFVIPKLVDHFHRRATCLQMGNLNVEREYNDVRFVCAAYLRLLAADVTPGTYNVCTGITYDLASILSILHGLAGHELQVQVDPGLVRTNEIRRLCGSPVLLSKAIGPMPTYTIEETLSWMLSSAC